MPCQPLHIGTAAVRRIKCDRLCRKACRFNSLGCCCTARPVLNTHTSAGCAVKSDPIPVWSFFGTEPVSRCSNKPFGILISAKVSIQQQHIGCFSFGQAVSKSMAALHIFLRCKGRGGSIFCPIRANGKRLYQRCKAVKPRMRRYFRSLYLAEPAPELPYLLSMCSEILQCSSQSLQFRSQIIQRTEIFIKLSRLSRISALYCRQISTLPCRTLQASHVYPCIGSQRLI